MNQYPHNCGASGPIVVDHTPASSFVIFRLVPFSQLPLSVTSVAFGARRRNVTVRSGWMSGERSIGRAAGGDGGGCCCATSGAPTTNANTATIPDRRAHIEMVMVASLERYSRAVYRLSAHIGDAAAMVRTESTFRIGALFAAGSPADSLVPLVPRGTDASAASVPTTST